VETIKGTKKVTPEELNQAFENAIRDGIREGVTKRMSSGYNSPMDKAIDAALQTHFDKFRVLMEESIATCICDQEFRTQIAQAVRHQLAKTLIQRFGGEMEKQVNVLKSDPTTRARITLAIEEIVKSKTSGD
jgi:hypothetical protein